MALPSSKRARASTNGVAVKAPAENSIATAGQDKDAEPELANSALARSSCQRCCTPIKNPQLNFLGSVCMKPGVSWTQSRSSFKSSTKCLPTHRLYSVASEPPSFSALFSPFSEGGEPKARAFEAQPSASAAAQAGAKAVAACCSWSAW